MTRGLGMLIASAALVMACHAVARADEAAPAVGEVRPEVYYLEDDAGRLVPVPGFRYGDFMDLFRLREGLPAALEPPAAVLESLVVTCDLARADAAAGTCPTTVACTVRQTRPGWVSLPLGLAGLLLEGPPRHEGAGRAVVDADPAGGYRCWFDAPAGAGDARHTLVLEGAVPVELGDTHDTLGLRLPNATAATVAVRTKRESPAAAVVPPTSARATVERGADGTSTVSLAGLSGPVRIRLATGGIGLADWAAVPQCAVESVVRIDGRNAFIDAVLRLESLRPDTATIDVALPPRTTLRAVRPPATLVARGGTADAPTATIDIERGRDGRAVVELECERPVDPSGVAAFEAIGFAVRQIETWRQWGRVSLVVEGDWRAEWSDGPGVRRVDPSPSARRAAFVAAFAYDSLPASLPVRVRPRVGRVNVEPEYRYHVGATRITLSARLRVAARGAPAAAIVLDGDPGFDIDEVGPPGVVDVTGVVIERGRVTIPFLQPLAGDALVELHGVRTLDRAATRLAWNLPVPRVDVVAPADVAVTADSDIELMPDAAASSGLVRQAASGRARADGETTLAYRMDGTRGTFAATRRFLARRVDATVAVRARLDGAEADVVETIRLDVAHVPLEFVDLIVPAAVPDEALEVRQDGTPLDPFQFDDEAADPAAGPRRVRAVLAEPLLGAGEVVVTFRLPTPTVPAQATVATDLPLVLPDDTIIDRQTVVIEAADRLAVEVRGDAWRAEASAADGARTWTAARRHDTVPLALAARQRAATDAVAEAAWLRTHLLPDRREDAALFVLSGDAEGATVTVPAAADTVTCTVALDGAPLPATRDANGFTVSIPRAAAARRRVLEVRTTAARPSGLGALGTRLGLPERLRLEPPAFGAGVAQRRFYWEIVTRPDEHVLGAPRAWTAQQRWRLGRGGLECRPVVDPDALAAWIRDAAGPAAAAVPPAEPALVAGRRVYSGIGAPGSAVLWIVPTWCAVLIASGIALAAGLALAYLPAARRSTVVVPVVAAVAVAAAALPDLAPLAAQAALPGVGLSILSWALRSFLDRAPRGRRPRPPAATVSASSLTRAVSPAPSLVITGSAPGREGSVTAAGKSSP